MPIKTDNGQFYANPSPDNISFDPIPGTVVSPGEHQLDIKGSIEYTYDPNYEIKQQLTRIEERLARIETKLIEQE